jgi:hypothetical protein
MILPHETGPGLSALSDEPALAIGRLDTPSYRRWVDRFLTRTAAGPMPTAVAAAVGGARRRIRFTAPASGTLFRLP